MARTGENPEQCNTGLMVMQRVLESCSWTETRAQYPKYNNTLGQVERIIYIFLWLKGLPWFDNLREGEVKNVDWATPEIGVVVERRLTTRSFSRARLVHLIGFQMISLRTLV